MASWKYSGIIRAFIVVMVTIFTIGCYLQTTTEETSFLQPAVVVTENHAGPAVVVREDHAGPAARQDLMPPATITGLAPPTLRLDNVTRLFYIRVPKTGSTTTVILFKAMSKIIKWNYPPDLSGKPNAIDQFIKKCKSCQENQQLINKMKVAVEHTMMQKTPILVSGHVRCIDYSRFVERDFPTYISVVRDPFDRLVSLYYYQKKLGPPLAATQEQMNMTYDECVQKKHPMCTSANVTGFFRQIPYFCGYDPICEYDNPIALAIAKKNVDTKFAVVGMTGYYNQTMQLLESRLPQYFKGLARLFNSKGAKKTNVNHSKKEATNSTRAIMMPLLHREYEFYNYVKEQFFNDVSLTA